MSKQKDQNYLLGDRYRDQNYLLKDQYKDASNLNARIDLHVRFSTNKYGWHRWVFDQFKFSPESRILELGCGPGRLWLENLHRIPDGWDITLSDFSPGMLQEAKRNLNSGRHPFKFEVVDAQAISFADESLDAVIANHMLYHVPDREKAFSEIRRVLKPGGRFYAATVGQNHLRELRELVRRFGPGIPTDGSRVRMSEGFSLENGLGQLSRWFSKVALNRYEDALTVTEAEPIVAYVRSGESLVEEMLTELQRYVEKEIQLGGDIHITKDTGIFEAWNDGPASLRG